MVQLEVFLHNLSLFSNVKGTLWFHEGNLSEQLEQYLRKILFRALSLFCD
jgi:hypothetical protein